MVECATARRMFRALVVLLVLTSLPACFYYAPAERPPPDPESKIRVHLAEPRDVETRDDVVVGSVVRLDGFPMSWNGDTLVINASELHRTGDRSTSANPGEVFWLAPDEVEQIETRRLDAGRSALWAGGVALAAGGLGALLFGGEGGGSEAENPDGDDPSQMDSPILDFVLSIPVFGRR